MIRVIGPAQQAGYKVIPGNRMEVVSSRLVSAADLVIIQRDFPRLTKAYQDIWERTRASGVPLIFDLDDLLLELPYNHPDYNNRYYADAYLPMMQGMLDADLLSASTPRLCDYLRTFNPKTTLLPNYLNDHIWRVRPPKPVTDKGAPVIIGYIGSNTHQVDLELIGPALLEILKRFGDRVLLKIWGPRPPEILQQQLNVQQVPLALYDYAAYANYLSEEICDIAIAPLEDHPFNRSKSSLKYLEYSALGLAGVYSKLPPYEEIIKQGENGYLATSPQEWSEKLSQLIEDPDLRYEMSVNAQKTIKDGWLLSQNTAHLETYFENLLPAERPIARLPRSTEVIEQSWVNLRMILTPPGSFRERVAWAPVRAAQIMSTEGLPGMARRLRESLGLSNSAHPTSVFLQRAPKVSGRRPYVLVLPDALKHVTRSADPSVQKISLNKTSIIILTYNNINYTRLCLKSIFSQTSGLDYEVIVVDNASSDGTREMLNAMALANPALKIILNDSNLGFAHGNNQGAAMASGDSLIFLNNDTIVTPGWLANLVKYLEIPQIGMVGPVTNSSGNESRIDFDYRNLDEMLSFAKNYTESHAGQVFEIGMLAFLCVGMRRSVFAEVGMLDEQFGLGMFEDDDYAIRVRQKHYQIICAQDVFIHHWGSASFSRLPSRNFYRIFNQNYKKFEKKWGKKWVA